MNYLIVTDVMRLLGVKQSKAYQIIRKLNKELENQGYLTISGKVSENYFYDRFYIRKHK